MPRTPRILNDSGVYHIISRGNNRQKLFLKNEDFLTYLELLGLMKKDYDFQLYHDCLMTNHVHLFIKFFAQEGLQKVMQRVNLRYAKKYRRLYQYVGPVFQDRFKSFPIEEDSYLLDCGRYIERNPIKAGIVKELALYPWSSYSFYAFGKMNELIDENPYYQALGQNQTERQTRYQEYVLMNRPYENLVYEAFS